MADSSAYVQQPFNPVIHCLTFRTSAGGRGRPSFEYNIVCSSQVVCVCDGTKSININEGVCHNDVLGYGGRGKEMSDFVWVTYAHKYVNMYDYGWVGNNRNSCELKVEVENLNECH